MHFDINKLIFFFQLFIFHEMLKNLQFKSA